MTDKTSYAQILKSSSIMGGAAGINMLLGAVRTKFAAILIGPLGVGMLGNYIVLQTLMSTLGGLGLQSSSVREISIAHASGDMQAMGRAVLTLRRMCRLTGLVGAIAMAGLSPLLSQLTFGSDAHAVEIALLGLVILFGNLSGGQMAIIQGTRRIGDLARVNVIGSLVSTIAAVGFYTWLGLRGIVPALLVIAVVSLAVSWHFARKVNVLPVSMRWGESFRAAGGMVRLGLSFMWSTLMVSLVGYATNALITHQLSLEAVGIYSAAFLLSGLFVNFVLNAMGADYYPRLTSVAHDKDAMNRLVNEQTEIGLLLAVPGLLATLSFAPWIIHAFYSAEFLPAAGLLQWFILGCLLRVIQWPMGYLQLALGKGKLFFVTQTSLNALHLAFIALCLLLFDLEGVAIAFCALYIVSLGVISLVARHLTGFRWNPASLKLFLILTPVIIAAFIATRLLPVWPATTIGAVATVIASILCLRGLTNRVGSEHRLIRMASRIPGIKLAAGIK